MDENNILFENQFGFRKQNSTVHALIQITEQITSSIENGKYGCGICIDLRKAFDTVNHAILLRKMEHYGIRGMALQWFKSYLNGHASALKEISCGIPKGSVLGPMYAAFELFLTSHHPLTHIPNFYMGVHRGKAKYLPPSPCTVYVLNACYQIVPKIFVLERRTNFSVRK